MSNMPGIPTSKPNMASREAQDHLLGHTLQDGEYLVQRVLGHGGMGKVYFIIHTSLRIPFALKQARADQPLPESVIAELDYVLQGSERTQRLATSQPQDVDFPATGGTHTDRFLREALLLTRLQHAAIPTLYDYFFEDGFWYLVMDYIPGPTLSHYLRQHAPLPPLEALNYAIQICDVLDYLHRQTPSIVFRDLKPSNLILTPEGALMLVDFGIARYFKTGQVNDTMDLGSPGYASPEQYMGEGQTDGRSDLFSLGIILHEMITGKRPSASGEVITSPADPRYIPMSSAMQGLIALATRQEPEQRFQSAHALSLALKRVYAIEEQLAYQRHIEKIERNQANTQPTHAAQTSEEQVSSEEGESMMSLDLDMAELVEPVPVVSTKTARTRRYTRYDDPEIAENKQSSVFSFNLEQRQQTRIALQHARRERLEQEDLEIQLASVDESLKRRSLVLRSQSAQTLKKPATEIAEDSQPAPQSHARSDSKGRHALKVCFLLTLLLCLLLASVVTYMRFARPVMAPITPPGSHPSPIPRSVTAWEGSWQFLPSPPSTEADNTAIYVQSQGQGYVYMNGGYRGMQSSPHYDRGFYRYDIMTAHWEPVNVAHFPGMLNNAVAQDEHGQLFFTAGYSTDNYKVSSLLYMYQPASGRLRTISMPAHVSIGFAATLLADQQGHLYLTQGYQKAGDPSAQAGTGWYRYDIATGTWHTLAPLPVGLGYVLLTNGSQGGILMLGGATNAGQSQQSERIYRYDIEHNRWQLELQVLPYPLSGAASCMADPEHLVVIGGYDATHKQGLNETWLVDLHSHLWIPLAPLPGGGSVLGTAACDGHGHVYLVRGASDPSHPTADFWLLNIQPKEVAS
jgi:serine/threonine protein kinase